MVGSLISKWHCCNINVKIFISWVKRYLRIWSIRLLFDYIHFNLHDWCSTMHKLIHFVLQILRLQESLSKYERTEDRSTPQVIKNTDKLFFFLVILLHQLNFKFLCVLSFYWITLCIVHHDDHVLLRLIHLEFSLWDRKCLCWISRLVVTHCNLSSTCDVNQSNMLKFIQFISKILAAQ
jgi:hypothetical protein